MPSLSFPENWPEIAPSTWPSPTVVLGGTDTGKSTAVQLFYEDLRQSIRDVAVIDGDPGQSTLGPPATLTAALPNDDSTFPPHDQVWHTFVGATTPRGHMLELVVGARKLLDVVRTEGADRILYDTTGLIDVHRGGRALKFALLNILEAPTVVALQRNSELEPLLSSLRHSRRVQVVDLPVPPQVKNRSQAIRRRHRADRFAACFDDAHLETVHWPRMAVVPNLDFCIDQLVAFETVEGFVRALGRIDSIDRSECTLTVETSLDSLDAIDTIRLGDVCLDPGTYEDRPR